MAYYTALIAKWATLTGTTESKLAQINALTVQTGVPVPAIFTPSQILNACTPADVAALTPEQVSRFALVLSGDAVDGSQGTTVRTAIQAIFAGKTTTLANLAALVAPFDNPVIPWWQATVAQGGGGLTSTVSASDLQAAGGLV